MMSKLFTAKGAFALAFGLTLTAVTPALAAEKNDMGIPGTFSANVALTSEYFFRGLSQTDDSPALQGGFDYEVEVAKPVSAYLGVWGSNVDFSATEAAGVHGASVEIDVYGGLRGAIGDTGLSWDAGVIYYSYPGADGSLNYDFVDFQGSLGYDFGVASAAVSLNYSPDNYAGSGNAYYPKLAVDVPIGDRLTLSGYVAKQFVEKNTAFGQPDYVEWNLGATYNIVGFDLNVAYTDTNIDGDPDGADGMVVFTVSRSF